jgi:DNA polymerase I-like protein with 3'-5' exonuclease and polymerase domains
MFGVPVTKTNENAKLRSPGKGLNFGIIFGMGPKKLYFKLNAEGYPIEFDATKKLYYKYCDEFKIGIRFLRDAGKRAAEQGWLANLNGRRRYWIRPNADNREEYPLGANDPKYQAEIGNIEREGGNFLVQSMNADLTKLAMVRMRAYKKQFGVRTDFLNYVYDEVVTTTHQDDSPSFVEAKRKIMIDAAASWCRSVPMEVEGSVGKSWTK